LQKYHKYNKKDKWSAVGIMSGTSCDGLDLALCEFQFSKNTWHYKIEKEDTADYPEELKNKLINVTELSSEELVELDFSYGSYIGQRINNFLSGTEHKPDLIASHGHTVFHQPEKGFTLQIGNGEAILRETQIPVVNDFRSHDIILGGQGAPLVPIGDKLLFGEYQFCLNLGGISNISFDKDGNRIAYDISPANLILNYLAAMVGQSYDKDGLLARKGNLDHKLFNTLNNCGYYREDIPKSLGIERIRAEFFPLLQDNSRIEDKLCTCVDHIAYQVNREISKNVDHNLPSDSKVLITGGGARNPVLIDAFNSYKSSQIEFIVPEPQLVDYKEALIFSFLGILKMRGEVNVLSSVTGAQSDSCSGVVHRS